MPLPDNMELQTPQKKEWPVIPNDVYQAEITDIEYKIEKNRYKQKDTDPDEVQKMNFEFTIIEEGPYYGRKVWQKMSPIKPYPPTGNGRPTWVYRLATAMEGHPITRDEADRFGSSNINGYIHRQVRLNIKPSAPDANGKQWNDIESFLSIKTELPLFDEKKIPMENQPSQPEAFAEPQNQSGYDKAVARASTLPGANRPAESNLEAIAPDIAEDAERMKNEEIDVDSIPF